MKMLNEIKRAYGKNAIFSGGQTDRYAPPTQAYCHVCDRNTPTELVPLSSGHIGNCCKICGTCRKGKPYASKREYQALNAPIGARRPEGDYEPAETQ